MSADDGGTGEGGTSKGEPHHEPRARVEMTSGPQPDPAAEPSSVEVTNDAPSEGPLEGRALIYLDELLKNINWMLTYANNNGIVLPDELREQIDALYKHPSVEAQTAVPGSEKKGSIRRWLPEFLRKRQMSMTNS